VKGAAPKPAAAAPRWAATATKPTPKAVLLIRLGAALMGLSVILSWWASPDRLASLPWSVIALAGVALVLITTGPALPVLAAKLRLKHLAWFFIVSGVIALLSALFTSRWPTYKIAGLGPVYSALPSIRSFSWGAAGLQPNQTGGFLAVCTGFAAAIAASPAAPRRGRIASLVLAVLGTIVVFMTGSRAALAGVLLVYFAILVVRTRRALWAWACGVLLVGVGLFASGQASRLFGFFLQDEGLDTKLASRVDIWSSALRGIQDHLFTGIGLGVFNQVIPARYPYHVVGLSFPVSQAHNLFLDVALAIGLPGLLGLLMILVGSVILALRWIGDRTPGAPIAMGILGSIVVYLVFGTTDSISLSVPTSFIIWLWASSLVVLYQMRVNERPD
jgi:O-antigen ligase